MTRITIKNAKLTPSLWRRIRQHALGSLFRVNTGSADLYTFTPDDNGKSWSGGWSWSDNPGTWDGDLAVNLIDKKLYKLEQ